MILCVDGACSYGYGKSIELASLQAAEDYGSSVGWDLDNFWFRKGLGIRISKIVVNKIERVFVCLYFSNFQIKCENPRFRCCSALHSGNFHDRTSEIKKCTSYAENMATLELESRDRTSSESSGFHSEF